MQELQGLASTLARVYVRMCVCMHIYVSLYAIHVLVYVICTNIFVCLKKSNSRIHTYIHTYIRTCAGIEQDYAKAFGWFLKAAELGDDSGQFNTAVLLYQGLGTQKDLDASTHWLSKAAAAGNMQVRRNSISVFEWTCNLCVLLYEVCMPMLVNKWPLCASYVAAVRG
jgi:hypothetical protein